jgi:hypothetical protein
MNNSEIKIGEILDLTINRDGSKTYIVGPVKGIRAGYVNPDDVAVLLGGLDIWLTLTKDVEVRYADR